MPLVDVLRAAMSEIEQYERVVLNVQPGIVVVGQAVTDVVHLLAEIVENATTFSPEDTQVHVSGQPLPSGGVLIDINDNGVGIPDQECRRPTGGWTTRPWSTWRCPGGWACSWSAGWPPGTASGSGCGTLRPAA